MRLENKIAIVTGAGQGMGEAIALTFAREGAEVVVNDINLANAEKTAEEIKSLGKRALAIQADVSSWAEVNGMVERVIREWGGVDILVHNAGIGNPRMVEDMTEKEWHHVLGVNLDGAFFCSKAVLGSMKGRGGGKIVFIASMAARSMSIAACAAYTSSKAGILGFARHLAFEVGPYKINVNAICPGGTLTPKLRATPEQVEKMKENIPLRDVSTAQDVANAVLFLVSDESRMITGTAIDVDAGQSLVHQPWETYVKRRKDAFARGEPAY
ncbi:MAG: short-chain dehydrogenase/reductase 3-oxoacyl-[acyl-carrier protein] reductase [Chloroflexi bacterium]|jgi:NAD(P)-dependent dehydrogenase (short-subunit alcohol dehydrogenase family)|nr:short-chain dehydrogenase/reductase 3-oxoacyl-[acyl-carrier protein] reductase [Chloroflexota bacterium]